MPVIAFIVGFLLSALAVNHYVGGLDTREYAAWSGIAPLEHKLDLYEAFAAEGPVDALVVGSSVMDYGLSARELSAAAERAGTPRRVFNLATGGGTIWTAQDLYRLSRLYGTPKKVYVSFGHVPLAHDVALKTGTDQVLSENPIAWGLTSDWLLPVSRGLYQLPVVREGPALRDLLLHGRPTGGQEIVAHGPHGDYESYTPPPAHAESVTFYENSNQRYRPMLDQQRFDPVALRNLVGGQLDGLVRLKEMVEADGGEVVFVIHNYSTTLHFTDEELRRFHSRVGRAIAAYAGVEVIDLGGAMEAEWYEVADLGHLNVHGAARAARIVDALERGATPAPEPVRAYAEEAFVYDEADYGLLVSSYVLLSPDDPTRQRLRAHFAHTILRGRFLDETRLVIVAPDGRRIVRPVRPVGRDALEADFSGEDLGAPSALRLTLEMVQPDGSLAHGHSYLTGYEWLPAPAAADGEEAR